MSAPVDLFALTEELVNIPSESFSEQAMAAFVEDWLASEAHLAVERIGDNVVARTENGCAQRLVLAGHTDTVPANDNAGARVDGDILFGVGSADMKGGLAVMLASARAHRSCDIDLTYVFYAREEVASVHSGLGELFAVRPDLLQGDLALIGEPTGAAIEAGCQGAVRVTVKFSGTRAHTARAWKGRNAIHRLAGVLGALASWEPRRPVIAGCEFHEAMLAVGVEGGVSGNVVPDEATLTIAHRFAPDRSSGQATDTLRSFLAPFLEADDVVEVVDVAEAAPPAVEQPLLAAMIARKGLDVRAKLGWTDVARFSAAGIPAANFGPGDPTVAHTQGEFLNRSELELSWDALDWLVHNPSESAL